MKLSKLTALLLTCSSLIACGDFYEETRLYGTWVEPLDGAIIEFQQDGTLIWDGEVGSFEFVRSSNWAVCGGAGGCADGQVSISLPSQSFRKSLYKRQFDQNPNQIYMGGRNTAGFPKNIEIYGKSVGTFSLYRQGSFSGELMPSHFDRMNAGIPEEEYFGPNVNHPAYVGGELVAEVAFEVRRFDEAEQRWVEIGSQYDMVWPLTGNVLYRNAPPIGEPHQVSLDAGRTWTDVPSPGDDSRHAFVDGTTLVSIHGEYDDDIQAFGTLAIWTLDLTASNRSWSKRSELAAGTTQGVSYDFKELGLLVVIKDDERDFEISFDYGVTWTAFTSPCYTGGIQRTANGFYCRVEGSTLSWFDFGTMSWTEHDVGFELVGPSFAYAPYESDAVYLINGEQLIAWRPDGTESITHLSSNVTGGVGKVMVMDDQVLVEKVTLWSTER